MNKMIATLMAAAALMASATTVAQPADKASRKALTAQSVRKAIDGRSYTVAVDMMQPLRTSSRSVNYDYGVRISGDSIYSYLPYVGRAFSVPYGGGKALNFEGVMGSYTTKRTKKNCTEITLTVANDEDTYKYTMLIFDNGRATINVLPTKREAISFSGEMER